MSYEGWANYETWAVNLWLSNDEGSYNYICELADESLTKTKADKHHTHKENAGLALSNLIKDFVEDSKPDQQKSSVYTDLLTHALGCVDYYEIAKAWLDYYY